MWNTVASVDILQKTIVALKNNGIEGMIVANRQEAKDKVIALLPKGAEVMNMTSVTLEETGIEKEIMESGRYIANRQKLWDQNVSEKEKQIVGCTPEWVVGSVHAVTQDGKVLIASNTGSQLAAYVYGAQHVLWVVGGQKVVNNLDDAMKRIYEYTLPLESERAKKAYGVPGSFVSKLLIVNREIQPRRIQIIFVKENLGF